MINELFCNLFKLFIIFKKIKKYPNKVKSVRYNKYQNCIYKIKIKIRLGN